MEDRKKPLGNRLAQIPAHMTKGHPPKTLCFNFANNSWLPTVDNLRCAKQSLVFLIGCKSRVRSNQPLIPSVAVVEEVSQSSNETIEAYTGHHIGRKRDRTL